VSSYEDQIATHKHAVQTICPGLSDAQLEGVWAIWRYHSPKSPSEERDFAVQGYLTCDCGISLEDSKRAVRALHRFDLCLF
jgi:hypothetical protein